MGLFDKKVCDNCGGKIGMLGNRKLEDANLCKECASKLSPWFSERKKSTLAEIQQQLRYREENKNNLGRFNTTIKIGGFRSSDYAVYIDQNQGAFFVTASQNYQNANPDIISFSQVVNCTIKMDEDRDEVFFKGPDGNNQSYTPPRYEYYYNFLVDIEVNHQFFNKIHFRLNNSRAGYGTTEFMNYQNAANQIAQAFNGTITGNVTAGMNGMGMNNMGMNGMGMNMGMNNMNGMGMNNMGGVGGAIAAGVMGAINNLNNPNMNGMNNMNGMGMNNMGMQNNMNGMGMNNMGMQNNMNGMGMNNMGMNNMGMQNNMNGMNNMNNTGMKQPAPGRMPSVTRCDKCGWEADANTIVGKFCPECGNRLND